MTIINAIKFINAAIHATAGKAALMMRGDGRDGDALYWPGGFNSYMCIQLVVCFNGIICSAYVLV